ncbi:MAG: T9SS type A sorting domain-containing protein [Saprospiraceae bacterium]
MVRTLPQQFCMDFNLQYNWNGSNFPIDSMVWDLDGGHFTANHNPPQSNIIQWDSPGIKFISLVLKDEGCESFPFRDTLQVDSFLDKPIIDCITTNSSVEFNWQNVPGATGYSVNVLTGQSGNQGQNTYLINGLNANEIVKVRVQAFGNTSCGSASDTLTCTAMDCPNIFLEITSPTTICPGTGSVPLTFLQTGGQGNGTATWSGPGVSGSEFLPQTLAPGIFTIELAYEEIGCLYNESIQIEIKDEEIASFEAIEDVCIHQSFVISFDGAADPSSTLYWNFDGATVISGFGMGPYTVSFDNPGTYRPSLEIISNAGCFSNIFTKEITVHDELSAPVIQCSDVSNSSITFEWNTIVGSNGYEISIDGGAPFTSLQNEYTLNGLDPGQQVSIEVRGISPWSCFAPTTNLTCETLNCPNLSINISPVNTICENETGLVTLNATVSPNVLGTGSWSGPNVSPNGILNLSGLPVGSNTITYDYSYLGCDYQATSNIMVTAAPEVNGSIVTPVFYTIGTSGEIHLSPDGNGPFDFQWSDGSFSQDRDSLRSGIYCVTVTDDNGCVTDTCYALDFGIFRISPVHIVCRGSSKILSIRPARGADFHWSPTNGLSCTDCPNPVASPNETTEYTLTATLPNGRSESVKILVVVIPPPFCPTAREIFAWEEALEEQLKSGTILPAEKIIEEALGQLQGDQNKIIVFPNPTKGHFSIKSEDKLTSIWVRDILGKTIFKVPIDSLETSLNIEHLPAGIYLLEIQTTLRKSKIWISKL